MNRRKALLNIFSISLVTGAGFSIFKLYSTRNAPSIENLIGDRELIAELAETIIPATDTPGAKLANVHDFIINVLMFCTIKKEQDNFMSGLENLKEYSKKEYGKSFVSCTADEKIKILTFFENKYDYKVDILNKINKKIFGQSFFTKLKSLSVEGYCFSKVGATEGLVYDYVPGSYKACLKLDPGQRSWATK